MTNSTLLKAGTLFGALATLSLANPVNAVQLPRDPSPSLSRNNSANWLRPDAASVTQVPREVAQEDANKQQPTNSQPQREKQPSNNAGREKPNFQQPSQKRDAITILQEQNQIVIDGQEALTNKFNKLPPLPGD